MFKNGIINIFIEFSVLFLSILPVYLSKNLESDISVDTVNIRQYENEIEKFKGRLIEKL